MSRVIEIWVGIIVYIGQQTRSEEIVCGVSFLSSPFDRLTRRRNEEESMVHDRPWFR